jgi:hypothetical protein
VLQADRDANSNMYIVPIAWLYVVILMSVAEANSKSGTLLGALFTFLIYGVIPLAILMYLMGTPYRWRAIKAAARAQQTEVPSNATDSVSAPNGGSKTSTDSVSAVREEP